MGNNDSNMVDIDQLMELAFLEGDAESTMVTISAPDLRAQAQYPDPA
ncbi:hypothetical protein [Streptomyces sp. NBC_00094]|nr:hypothetical protein [Streptomyces sp. NBC_00094]MCX5395100.1 hypothetical protein [Streptomyces sp. NBC_00094]